MGTRDIDKLNYFRPPCAGDTVVLNEITWVICNRMDGWALSADGGWRTDHPDIKKIIGVNDFIAALVHAKG